MDEFNYAMSIPIKWNKATTWKAIGGNIHIENVESMLNQRRFYLQCLLGITLGEFSVASELCTSVD